MHYFMNPIIALSEHHERQWYIYEDGERYVLQVAELKADGTWRAGAFPMKKKDYLEGIERLTKDHRCEIPLDGGQTLTMIAKATRTYLRISAFSAESSIHPAEYRDDCEYYRQKERMRAWEETFL